MSVSLGLVLALVTLLSWGIGDFFIQRATRLAGSIQTLFLIGVLGAVLMLPFVEFSLVNQSHWPLITALLLVDLFTAAFNFEALRRGKIAVVEPVVSLELPITVALSLIFVHENLTGLQLLALVVIFIGILLTVTKRFSSLRSKTWLERGVLLAGVAAISMALENVLVGITSQSISPVFAIWATDVSITVCCGSYLLFSGQLTKLWQVFKRHPIILLTQSFLDNVSWLAYAGAVLFLPISIAIGISESYVAIAVLLGLIFNREKLKFHQLLGVGLVTFGVVCLAFLTA